MSFLKVEKNENKRFYLDWAAASPLLPEAKVAMLPYLDTHFGNPSAVHKEGQVARQAVEDARESVARTLSVKPAHVFFTGGGTEGNNVAIIGYLRELHRSGVPYREMEVVSTALEHPSIMNVLHTLSTRGVTVHYAPVHEDGVIDMKGLEGCINERTRLVTVGYVNSEIGVIQPLGKIARLIKSKCQPDTRLHADGAQAPLWLACQPERLGVDLLTLDAGKFCGPKGVGVLVSRGVELAPVLIGGGQERGCRPGTENVAGIVGAATALSWAQAGYEARAETVRAVRDEFFSMLSEELSEAVINGAVRVGRVANNINISLPGIDTEFATVVLDAKGFAISTKSACAGAGGGESTVVRAISADPARAASTLRITLGPDISIDHLRSLITVLKQHIKQMQTI